jgi:hypothetical protein
VIGFCCDRPVGGLHGLPCLCSAHVRGDQLGPLACSVWPCLGSQRVRVWAVCPWVSVCPEASLAYVLISACSPEAHVGHSACVSSVDRVSGAHVGHPPVLPFRACFLLYLPYSPLNLPGSGGQPCALPQALRGLRPRQQGSFLSSPGVFGTPPEV